MTAIGIDLGTTYSCVAVLRNGKIEIVPNNEGDRLTPSCVSFSDTEILTGKAAKDEIPFNFENTLFQIKRLIGRKFDDPNVQQDSEFWGFKIINEDNKPKIQVKYKHEKKTYYPEKISALILEQLKESAEAYMGCKFTDAVITVPAYFNDSQRKATKEAGRIAGLNVLQMINEPTAAAIAYGLDREKKDERHVLIFDLGGGTFDVTLITIKDRVFDVKATGGDTHLGGEDFVDRMVTHFVEEFNTQNKVDISENKRAMSRLRIQCEAAKQKLSVSMIAKVQVYGFHDGKDYKTTISRAKFEELNYDYFERILQTVDTTLSDANFNKERVDEVVLVGGSTRIPKLRKMIQEYFNGKELYKTINPDEAVAHGAAALAVDLSTGASAKVYQGERTSTRHNKHLGSFSLSGICPAPRRVPRIDVCFDIDSSGILTVTAKDNITGNKNNLQLESAQLKLTVEEIDRMVQEAEIYRLEDIEFRNLAEMREKLETLVFNTEESAISLDSQGELNKEEKKILLQNCKSVFDWLSRNKNASKETLFHQQIKFQNCCHPIFIRICREKQTKHFEQQKKEEERKPCQKALEDLIRSIHIAESKAKLPHFKRITEEKFHLLHYCQRLKKWAESNQNAKEKDIYDNLKKFREWSEGMFEKMEEAAKTENQKELQLISESKQKLEKCLGKIIQAVTDPKYADNLSNAEAEEINSYCVDAYALLDKSNPSQKEMDERRKLLEQNCYSIFVQIDSKVQTEIKLEKVDLVALENFRKKVFDATYKLFRTNKITSNQGNTVIAACNKISDQIRSGEIKTSQDYEKYYGILSEVYQPIKELEKRQNMNSESKRQRHPCENKKVTSERTINRKKREYDSSSLDVTANIVRYGANSQVSSDRTSHREKREYDSSRREVAVNRESSERKSYIQKQEYYLSTLDVTGNSVKYGANTQSRNKLHGEEYHSHDQRNERSTKDQRMKTQREFRTIDETSRPISKSLHSPNYRTGKQTSITEAKAHLLSFANEIKTELNGDASIGILLSPSDRNRLYGNCAEVISWLNETKNVSLEEIERKRHQLRAKYRASGLGSSRQVLSSWL
uniref:heat shock 70 kDa protein 1B-like n=1 Tax=Styela clava TaxID=7725 RepID=UPI00193ADF84|nr:heat shock 70 kDa protein 1B-like [Styela clava]